MCLMMSALFSSDVGWAIFIALQLEVVHFVAGDLPQTARQTIQGGQECLGCAANGATRHASL